jgi:MFS family permease
VVVPRYLRQMGLDEQQIGLTGFGFGLAALGAMGVAPGIAERLGRRVLVVSGMLVCALGCAVFELGRHTAWFALARGAQGAGWGMVMVGITLSVTELAPEGRLAQAIGVAGVVLLAAMALGPTLGEWLAARTSYLWVFRAAALVSLLGALIGCTLPDGRGPAPREGPPPTSPFRRMALRPLLATLLSAMGFGAVMTFLADYTGRLGIGSMAAFFQAYVATAIGVRICMGGLADRIGRHPVILPAVLGQALASAALALLSAAWQLWPIGCIFGLAHGLYYPALQALIVERASGEARAKAAASSNIAFALGNTVSALVYGTVAKHSSYAVVYGCSALLSLVALALMEGDRRALPS